MPGDSKKIQDILAIVSENNRILRRMQRQAFWGVVFKVILYAVLFGIPVVLYFSIVQPMLQDVVGMYSQIQEAGNSLHIGANAQLDSLQGLVDLLSGGGL